MAVDFVLEIGYIHEKPWPRNFAGIVPANHLAVESVHLPAGSLFLITRASIFAPVPQAGRYLPILEMRRGTVDGVGERSKRYSFDLQLGEMMRLTGIN